MIVDIHTHIFPPEFVRNRERLVQADPAFSAIYGNPRAAMATAEDLLASMAAAGVDCSVACGFWWSDPATAAEHAAYLVEAAAYSGGAIVPFVPAAASAPPPPGAAGLGEVRADSVDAVPETALPLLLHCSEEVGHAYPGKTGGLTPAELWRLVGSRPEARVIAAHWGGGFPFYGLMPEVRDVIAEGRLLFDTAASRYLYHPDVFSLASRMVGAEAIAWGSDFPLRPQDADLAEVRHAIEDPSDRALILGENAMRFLGLPWPATTASA